MEHSMVSNTATQLVSRPLALCGLLWLATGGPPAQAQDAPAIPAVDVAALAAKEVEWQEKVSSIGVAEALQGVNVSGSEVGTVAEILFDSGQSVQVGQA